MRAQNDDAFIVLNCLNLVLHDVILVLSYLNLVYNIINIFFLALSTPSGKPNSETYLPVIFDINNFKPEFMLNDEASNGLLTTMSTCYMGGETKLSAKKVDTLLKLDEHLLDLKSLGTRGVRPASSAACSTVASTADLGDLSELEDALLEFEECYISSLPGFAVLDCGCTSSLIGEDNLKG